MKDLDVWKWKMSYGGDTQQRYQRIHNTVTISPNGITISGDLVRYLNTKRLSVICSDNLSKLYLRPSEGRGTYKLTEVYRSSGLSRVRCEWLCKTVLLNAGVKFGRYTPERVSGGLLIVLKIG